MKASAAAFGFSVPVPVEATAELLAVVVPAMADPPAVVLVVAAGAVVAETALPAGLVAAAAALVAGEVAAPVVPAGFGVSVALLLPQAARSTAAVLAAVPARIVRREIVVCMDRSFFLVAHRDRRRIAHG